MTSKIRADKRKRVVLTINQKLDIIKRLEKGERAKQLLNEFNIGKSSLYDIKGQKTELLKFVEQSHTCKAKDNRYTLAKPKLEQLDSVLYQWFSSKRAEGNNISGPLIIEKAKDLYSQMGLTESCSFSNGWLNRFKERHQIGKLKDCRKKPSANHEVASAYCQTLQDIINEHSVTADHIYNAYETGLYWRCLPTSTLAGVDETFVSGLKKNKDRISVLTCANASGKHKLKLLVIGKKNKPRCFENKVHLPVIYKAQPNAYLNSDIFLDWFRHHFVPAIKKNLRKHGKPEDSKIILLFDNCSSHPPAHLLVSGNIFTIYLPPNVTSLIQPMDQGVIQNLKSIYKEDFMHQLIQFDGKIIDFQRNYSIYDAVCNLALAWRQVKSHTLRRAWRTLYNHNILEEDSSEEENEFEGFLTRKGSIQVSDVRKILQESATNNPVLTAIDNAEIEEWINIDLNLPVEHTRSDCEFIQSAINPNSAAPRESDSEEEKEPSNNISWSEAASAVDIIIKFTEHCAAFSSEDAMTLRLFKKNFLFKRLKSFEQADLRSEIRKETVNIKYEEDFTCPSTSSELLLRNPTVFSAASSTSSIEQYSITLLSTDRSQQPETIPDFEGRMSSSALKLENSYSEGFLSCSSAIPVSADEPVGLQLQTSSNEREDKACFEDNDVKVKMEPLLPSEIGMTRPYLLKKDTHCSSILDELLKDETFTDVTLTAEGQRINAHRNILCLSSNYFKDVLSKESTAKNVIFFRDLKFEELKNIITFMYIGEVIVDSSDLESFMKTAELLEVASLCEGHKYFRNGFPTSHNSNSACLFTPTSTPAKRTTPSSPSSSKKFCSFAESDSTCKSRTNQHQSPTSSYAMKAQPVVIEND